jgi:hypothetical protein
MTALSQPDGYCIPPRALTRLGDGSVAKGRARLRLFLADHRDREPEPAPAQKPANVRLAGPADEPAILALLLSDLADNAGAVAPVSAARVLEQIQMGTRQRGGFALVIDGPDGKPVATSLSVMKQSWWSDHCYLEEVCLYVAPAGRRGDAAGALLQMQKWLAQGMSDSLGYRVYLLASVTATQRRDAKTRLYARYCERLGGIFVFPAIGSAA